MGRGEGGGRMGSGRWRKGLEGDGWKERGLI